MESDFDITLTRIGDSLLLKLAGDFDESSARRLIDVLRVNSEGVNFAFIKSNDLNNVLPSGKEVFRSKLQALGVFRHRLVFTDENGVKIAPGGIYYY